MDPEEEVNGRIDGLLTQAGWALQNVHDMNLYAGRGIAVREFPLKPGHGETDYLLYVDGKAAGVVEAKRLGFTLTGVEPQSHSEGLSDDSLRGDAPCRSCTRALEAIRDHIAESVSIGLDDFQLALFDQQGGLGRAYTLFGKDLEALLEELNRELVA